MKSPCLSCSLQDQSKNSAACENCEARIKYVESIGHERLPTVYKPNLKPPSEPPKHKTSLPPSSEPKTKRCSSCKKEHPLTEFQNKSSQKDGHDIYCRACKSTMQKKHNDTYYNKKHGVKKPPPKQKPKKEVFKCDTMAATPQQFSGSDSDDLKNIHTASIVDITPIIQRAERHINEARKVIKFLTFLKEETGGKFEIPNLAG